LTTPVPAAVSRMTSKLQSLTQLWQEFDLPGTQRLLDELATGITTRQDESDGQRKLLIELIRNFKKNNSEETRLVVGPLLKSFQNEIDSLSKRSKSAEKSFFDIYKKFCDIADPVPTLEYCMESLKSLQKLQDLEIENNQLRETLSDYNVEITEYKVKAKRLEELEKKLEDYEKSMEATLDSKIEAKEEQLSVAFEEKVKLFEEEKKRSDLKLAESETKCKGLQTLVDDCQSELFDLKSRHDAKRDSANDEIELLITDVDRANQRALTAEKELLAVQDKLDELNGNDDTKDIDDEYVHNEETSELRLQLTAKEREVVQLFEDIQKNSKTLQETELKHLKIVADLEKHLSEKETEREELAMKLSKQTDYETIKKDLSILKTLEFPSHDPGENDSRPLEVLILERSKGLQAENSMLRLDKERLVRDLATSQGGLTEATEKVEKQSLLITQLEEHVEQLQTISTPFREEAEGRSSSDMLAEALRMEPLSDDVFDKVRESPVPLVGSCTTSPDSNSSTLLPIVQAQRERYRLRNEELETQALEQQQQVNLLTRQVSDLQMDNVKLFEKIRFLQACGDRRGARGTTDSVVLPVENIAKYQTGYEQKLDPFHSFGQAEKQRKYGQLSVFEKVILSLVRFIVSNKTARLAVFFYSVLLHGLVFAVLYKLAMTESCRHDMAAQWHEKYIEHMQAVHGDTDHVG